jgi:hypothetical protein
MSKYEGHTPGPWKAEKMPDNLRKMVRMVITKNDLFVTAMDGTETHGFVAITNSANTGDANAKLIADAPMLAEQNEKALSRLKEHCEFCHFANENSCPDSACQTKALIAEIEGAE